jgi:N-acetylated-alpha-linked acidic dipeptidase
MRTSPAWIGLILLATGIAFAEQHGSRLGFFPESREAQDRGEEAMLATPTPQQSRTRLRKLTEEPHVAGTEGGRAVAEEMRDRFREFGLEADLVSYHVLLNYPESASLKLVEPEEIELSLFEEGHPGDKDSFSRDAFPAFHGYGASGTASAQVVYANYATDEDFRTLEDLEIRVEGRIVLARYGRVFRGLKVREAQKHGAIGVILYSDPFDDGYMKGDVYPDGPMRPPSAIQRGSVQFLSEGPGDPQTPGVASTKNAKRIPRRDLEGIPHIPSVPISYGEAEKILRRLAGPRVPDAWQGGLPFAYHLGPGPAKVSLDVAMDYDVRPIWNVIGKITGAAEPDRWIIVGNHHDAWTYGAVDPSSGTTSLLEMARGLGAALKAGWKPRRTLILAGWDAEEYGLVGSTEWGEDLAAELSEKAVAYLNLDSSVTGPDLGVSGIPSLRDLLMEVAGDLTDPRRGKTLLELWTARQREVWNRETPIDLNQPEPEFRPSLGAMGSGSDYTVFVDHLGIAALNFGFSGGYGVYHSTLDNFFWMEKFGDPEFLYHALAARLLGLLTMRLASADVVPLRYVPYADALNRQLDDLRRNAVRERRGVVGADEVPDPAPLNADFAPVRKALRRFREAAASLDVALDALQAGPRPPEETLGSLNDAVVGVERQFLSEEGLPGRPWFRHLLYAPGLTTGYASWPFPGLAQAIKDRNREMWDAELPRVVARLEAAVETLDEAARLARETSSASG